MRDGPSLPAWSLGLRGLGRQAVAEAQRLLRVNARFPLEFFGSLVLLYGTFFVLHAAARRMPLPGLWLGGSLSADALPYALWLWSAAVVNGVPTGVAGDAASGLLEPLLASGVGGARLVLARVLGAGLQCGVPAAGLVVLTVTIDGAGVPASAWPAAGVAAACCGVASAGFAMALAGAALVARRVTVLSAPISILLLWAFLSPPGTVAGVAAWLPYIGPRQVIDAALSGHLDLAAAARGSLVSAGLAMAGAMAYTLLERRARATGRLSLA